MDLSKSESRDNNKKELKESKIKEDLDIENTNDYIRKNERLHYIDDNEGVVREIYTTFYKFSSY
jgi:hypothetical protein